MHTPVYMYGVVPLDHCALLQGYNEHEQFILAEGPMEITNFDFLRLIWEAQPSAIVMLCQLEEDGKVRGGKRRQGKGGRGGRGVCQKRESVKWRVR